MAAEWYYTQDGNQHGPVSGSDLKQLAASGKLLPSDLAWKEGMDEWKPAAQVKGLFPERQPTAGPPPLSKRSPSGSPPSPPPARSSACPTAGSTNQGVASIADKAKAAVRSEPVQRVVRNIQDFWSKLSGRQKASYAAGIGVGLILLVWMMQGDYESSEYESMATEHSTSDEDYVESESSQSSYIGYGDEDDHDPRVQENIQRMKDAGTYTPGAGRNIKRIWEEYDQLNGQ